MNDGTVIAGLYQEGTHHLVNLDNCLVQDPKIQEIINHICRLIEKFDLPVYDERKIGGIRTVMVRRSQKQVKYKLFCDFNTNYFRWTSLA